jgi:hypothetical protein
MRMRENMQDVYKVLTSSETLLRLLYYKPSNAEDDPLSELKPNILDMSELGEGNKWSIIQDRIKTIPKVDDLDKNQICRLLFYPSNRHRTDNYLISDQDITFDILVHFAYEDVDQRLEWICDVLNELMFDKRITGMGKVTYVDGRPLSVPQGYVGYRLVYSFGSGNRF